MFQKATGIPLQICLFVILKSITQIVTQNGLVRTYAAYILGGVILALVIVFGFWL